MSEILTAIGIKVDPSKAKSGSKEVVDSLDKVNKKANSTKKLMAKVFAGVSVFASVRLFKSIALDFAEFDQGMKNVASVSGATTKELDLLTLTAKNLAENTRFNPKQATEGLYALASAGQSVQEQIATLPNVLDLAESAQADLGLTTELLVSSMAQFQLSASDSQRVADTFTASIANSSTNVQRLSVAMRNSGSTANAFNQDFESSVSVLSILTTAFGNGEKAGTGYKTLLTSLAKNAKQLGIDVSDASGQMKPLGKILDEIKAKGTPALELMTMFGESGSSLAILLEKGSVGINEMTEKLISNGQASETASKQINTLKGDWDQLGSATDLLKIELGALTNEGLRPFIQGITEMVKTVRANIPEIIATIKTLGAVLATAFGARLIKGMITGLTGIGGASAIAGAGIRGLTVAVAGLVSIGGGLLKFFGGWVGLLVTAGVGIATYITAIGDTEKATGTLVDRNKELLATMENLSLAPLADALVETKISIVDMTNNLAKAEEALLRYNYTEEAVNAKLKEQRAILATTIEQRDALIKKMKEVADARKASLKAVEDGKKAVADENAVIETQKTSLKSWLKSARDQVKKLKERNILLKDGKKALQDYLNTQARSLASNKAELDQINSLIEKTAELSDSNDSLAEQKRIGIEDQRELNGIYNDYINLHAPLIAIERDRQAELDNLFKLYNAKLIPSQHEYMIKVAETNTKFNQMAKEIQGVNNVAGRSKGIFGTFFDTIKNGFKDVFSDIKGFFKNAGGAGGDQDGEGASASGKVSFYAQVAQVALDAYNASAGKDDAGRVAQTVVGVLGLIPGWGQAIAAVATLVDGITGGKLFGTSYEQTGSGFTGGIGSGGSQGSQFTEQQRERSFFRGTQTRIETSELDQQILDVFDNIYEQAQSIANLTARALGIETAELITGSISQTFDADGNLKTSISTVLGKTYNEGIEEFGKRIVAENILAQLSANFGFTRAGNGDGNSGGSGGIGGGDGRGPIGLIREKAGEINLLSDEINDIAERWRFSAELLLEGSQFLMTAVGDMANGFDLLQNGSITEITDLVEELNQVGETLSDTYVKMAVSVKTFDLALDLANISLTNTREEVVRFATEITESAGGLEQASALWGSYFNNYFTNQELVQNQLETLNNEIATTIEEMGVDVNFDNFRSSFEEALPDLTPKEIVDWLRLGDSLSRANDLAGELATSGLEGALEQYVGLANDMTESSYSLSEQFRNSTGSINNMIEAYDGSIRAEDEIAGALSSRYTMEIAFIEQIRSASQSINQMMTSSIDNIRFGQMTDEERYDELTLRAEALASTINDISDPAQLEQAVAEINRLQSEAYGLLDEGQQAQLAEGFIEFLEEVNTQAQAQLDGIELEIGSDSDSIVARLQTLLLASQEREDQAVLAFGGSVTQMGTVVQAFDNATRRLDQIQISVDVNGGPFQDVSNV